MFHRNHNTHWNSKRNKKNRVMYYDIGKLRSKDKKVLDFYVISNYLYSINPSAVKISFSQQMYDSVD